MKNHCSFDSNLPNPVLVLTWAVPIEFTSTAIVNVVTMKLPKIYANEIGIELIPKVLNQSLMEILASSSEDSALFQHEYDDEPTSTSTNHERRKMKVHTAGVVKRPCAPERRESETYAAFIPWAFFDPKRKRTTTSTRSEGGTIRVNGERNELIYKPKHSKKQPENKKWRIPIEETGAVDFVDYDIPQRLKHGARIMKDFGQEINVDDSNDSSPKLKVRTCAMGEPMQSYCRISMSMRQTVAHHVERLVGLLVAFTRSEISEGDLLVALKLKTCKEATADQGKNNRSTFHPIHFPLNYIVLIEPALTRFENKAKLKLCRYGKTNTRLSESAEQSIEDSEESIMRCVVQKREMLNQWVESQFETKH